VKKRRKAITTASGFWATFHTHPGDWHALSEPIWHNFVLLSEAAYRAARSPLDIGLQVR
jgi:hypothetical protein